MLLLFTDDLFSCVIAIVVIANVAATLPLHVSHVLLPLSACLDQHFS